MSATPERLHVKIIGWLLIAGLLYATVELCAWAILKTQLFENGRSIRLEHLSSALSEKQKQVILSALTDENPGLRIDDDLGWVAPIRSPGERTKGKAKGTTRIVAFGDSYTHGAEVEAEEAWPFLLEEMLQGVEVLNFGVPAYGLDQAYLRYRLEGKQYDHDILIIGFIIEDADRNIGSFRPFQLGDTGIPFAKPRFVLDNEQLRLIPSPLRRADYPKLVDADCAKTESGSIQNCTSRGLDLDILSNLPSAQLASLLSDRTTRMDISDEEKANTFNLAVKIFSEFYREAQANGTEPLILLMPMRVTLFDNEPAATSVFAAYEDFFEAHNMRFLNVTQTLRQTDPVNSLFKAWGHYSPLGNKLVAQAVSDYLKNEGLIDVPTEHADIPEVSAKTAQYRFVQWEITKKRAEEYTCIQAHCIQASRFTLLSNSKPAPWPNGTITSNPGGSNSPGEEAMNVIDGTRDTKWLDSQFNDADEVSQTGSSLLIIDTGTGNSIAFNGYRWATANDEPGRDPVSWNIYGSQDGASWVLLDARTDETIPMFRKTFTNDYLLKNK